LGFLLPSSSLGVYAIAKLLVNAAEVLLDRLSSSLALPVFGEVIRDDPQKLQSLYYRFRLAIDLAAALISGVLFASGTLIVKLLYDPRYFQAGAILQILAVGLAIYQFHLIKNAFIAAGDTRIAAIYSVIQAISIVSCIVIG